VQVLPTPIKLCSASLDFIPDGRSLKIMKAT
jgi:hypothetical protein